MIKDAIEIAHTKAQHKLFLHAALIVKNGEIISTGYNHDSIHAEVDALLNGPLRVDGAEIVSIRIRRSGRMGMARPCRACWKMLRRCGISRVRYSDTHGNIVSEKI